MKIIFSPAKTFSLAKPILTNWQINPLTEILLDIVKNMSMNELSSALKLNSKMLETVAEYIEKFDVATTYQAIELYSGTAFKALDAKTLDKDSLDYLNEHLLILSAFYGVCKPYDLIKPYRLDFTSKIKVDSLTLKKFWKDYYNSFIAEGETVVNLASNEFSSLFDKEKYDWWDFDFYQMENGIKKSNSVISKKMRGSYLREIAQRRDYKFLAQVKK